MTLSLEFGIFIAYIKLSTIRHLAARKNGFSGINYRMTRLLNTIWNPSLYEIFWFAPLQNHSWTKNHVRIGFWTLQLGDLHSNQAKWMALMNRSLEIGFPQLNNFCMKTKNNPRFLPDEKGFSQNQIVGNTVHQCEVRKSQISSRLYYLNFNALLLRASKNNLFGHENSMSL